MGQNFLATISAPKIGSPLLLLLLAPRMLREGVGCADVRCLGQSGGRGSSPVAHSSALLQDKAPHINI